VNLTLEQFDSIVSDVFTTVAGLTVQRRQPDLTAGEAWVTSQIEIRGPERVELQLTCGRGLAATLASAFFGGPVPASCHDDVGAAMLELANIVAGHVAALMDAPRRIACPVLVGPAEELDFTAPDLVVAYAFEDDVAVVTVRVHADRGEPVP
jgi:hypothetical protein